MNRIIEFYESNHLLVLIGVIILFGIYMKLSKKEKNEITSSESKTEDEEEIIDNKITSVSVVKLKYILTGEVVTLRISESQSNKAQKKSEIQRIYFRLPLADSLLGKETGAIIKYKINPLDEKDIYVEVLEVNNSLFSEEELDFFKAGDLKNAIKVCNSKEDLILEFERWLETEEPTIGNGNYKTNNSVCIRLVLNENHYYINADSTRAGIKTFVDNYRKPREVIANKNNNYNKVSNDINADPNRSGVLEFLENKENKENKENNWIVIENENGIKNKVTNRIDSKPIKGFYMYKKI